MKERIIDQCERLRAALDAPTLDIETLETLIAACADGELSDMPDLAEPVGLAEQLVAIGRAERDAKWADVDRLAAAGWATALAENSSFRLIMQRSTFAQHSNGIGMRIDVC